MKYITKPTLPLYRPRPIPRPIPRPKIQRYTIVDGEFRDIDRHTRRLQIIGLLFALATITTAGLLLAYALMLRGA